MQLTLIIIVFIVMCLLMYSKKLNAMIALPLMALLIAVIAGIPWADTVIGETTTPGLQTLLFIDGPSRLGTTIITFIFGAILSMFVKHSGIAEATVRKVSEFAGDRPMVLAISLYVVLSLLFTTLSGLGSVIMLGSIVLPIMISVGLSPITAGCVLLFSLSVGGVFNMANWSLYINTFGIAVETVRNFAYVAGIIFGLMGLLMIIVDIKFGGITKLFKKNRKLIAWPATAPETGISDSKTKVHWYALLTPIVPLVCVVLFKMNINTGFVIGIVYGFLTTLAKDSMQRLIRSITEGISNSAGAIFLLIGIGMVLKVVMDSRVTAIIGPALSSILPSSPLTYVLFFSILAPLALYRGPLNIWGLGLGLGSVMLATGKLSAVAIMAALMTTGQIQGICDPTNTHNVWVAAETGLDVNDLLKRTLPYVWCGVVIGLIVAACMYF